MTIDVREIDGALELAIADQRNNISTDESYEEGYLDGPRAGREHRCHQAARLKTGVEAEPASLPPSFRSAR